ncbi:hypothetical protein AX774_g3239 [Zancudomyces culisetae]|uniref:Uncharacterized protein n=1 Tax=Zancudomyces culisetae TaxID=1213189 RepID=A0A1R1PQL8_ZANCU|nr:hypothetical protein AX774_g3239 [Zancudomyces culisetae]|eukprot:OMH83257.1 hypothetical protein AX774_g3239 [Zancudomyces culisetae]
MSLDKLTSKLCFLLAICVFMRPSDKKRIDESRTTSSLDSVKFTMVASKEKRMGLSINKTVYITSHSEKRPKASALGSTLATEASASIYEVVSQGYWSSRSVFDSVYRLSRQSRSNLTELVFNPK